MINTGSRCGSASRVRSDATCGPGSWWDGAVRIAKSVVSWWHRVRDDYRILPFPVIAYQRELQKTSLLYLFCSLT